MNGYASEQYRLNANSLIRRLGLAFDSQGICTVTYAPHPVMEAVPALPADGAYRVVIDAIQGGSHTLFADTTCGPVGVAHEREQGRVVVWGDEWVAMWTSSTPSADLGRFWTNTFRWLRHF